MTDTLASAAQAGDEQAFLQLMDDCKERLYRIAYAYLRSEADALEAIQETTCKAWQRRRQLRDYRFFQTWLTRILLNCCADEYKRRNRHRSMLANFFRKGYAEDNRDKVELDEAVGALPPKLKVVVVLKYYQQLTIAEIAEVLDCPEGTVKTRLHQALKSLRHSLGEEGVPHAGPNEAG